MIYNVVGIRDPLAIVTRTDVGVRKGVIHDTAGDWNAGYQTSQGRLWFVAGKGSVGVAVNSGEIGDHGNGIAARQNVTESKTLGKCVGENGSTIRA